MVNGPQVKWNGEQSNYSLQALELSPFPVEVEEPCIDEHKATSQVHPLELHHRLVEEGLWVVRVSPDPGLWIVHSLEVVCLSKAEELVARALYEEAEAQEEGKVHVVVAGALCQRNGWVRGSADLLDLAVAEVRNFIGFLLVLFSRSLYLFLSCIKHLLVVMNWVVIDWASRLGLSFDGFRPLVIIVFFAVLAHIVKICL